MKLVRSILQGLLSPEDLEKVSGGFDAIGTIAIIKLPPEWPASKKKSVGEALIEHVPRIRSVWNQTTPFGGEFRIRGLENIAGDPSPLTEYREHGVRMLVDVTAAYFSPRLSTERLRVAAAVAPGEQVFNMFSGVGPFSLVIAKKSPAARVVSSEINPAAYELMVKNIALNKVQDRVFPLLGDCREHSRKMHGQFDRLVMSLPSGSREFLDDAVRASRPGATIHYYASVRSESSDFVKEEWARISLSHPYFELAGSRIVTEAGPRTAEVVLDLLYQP